MYTITKTIKTINMEEIPEAVKRCFRLFKVYQHETYLVGGSVRDMLLEKTPEDWDIAANASVDEIVKICQNVFKTSVYKTRWQTVRIQDVTEPNISIEITPYKYGNDLYTDLLHRDFTMNAIAVDDSGNFYDPFGGREDLENSRLKFTNGDIIERVNEDPLRLLRMLRFLREFHLTLDADLKKVNQLYPLLDNIKPERIFPELCKFLLVKRKNKFDAFQDIICFKDIICAAVPELKVCEGYNVGLYQTQSDDLYRVIMKNIDIYTGDDIILKLALLFHDVAKPYVAEHQFSQCDKINEYFNHKYRSADMANLRLLQFRCSNKIRNCVVELIKYQDNFVKPNKKSIRKLIHKLGIDQAKRLILFQDLITHFGENNVSSTLLEKTHDAKFIFYELEADYYNHIGVFNIKDLNINGYDLLNMGFKENHLIGVILRHILNAVLEEKIENTYEDCVNMAKLLKNVYEKSGKIPYHVTFEK